MAGYAQARVSESAKIAPPHGLLAIAEPARAAAEASTLIWARTLLRRAPKGDGHAVLVLPGFMASDVSTRLLRRCLREWGYTAHPWKLGRNLGPVGTVEHRMEMRLDELADRYGRPVSIVGWSLGGIYARELARRKPDCVRQVLTLGSPFAGAGNGSNVVWLYDRVTGERVRERGVEFFEQMMQPPPAPSTAIFSKSDGVASWRSCIELESPTTDNIEVVGSHCGLGFNPVVLFAIADRLAQPEHAWRKFDRSGWRRFFYA